MKNIQSQKGFTLAEMLVVVFIVALLSSVAVIGLGGVRSQGRDTKRIADLRQVQNALELYYAKCGHYPGSATEQGACGTTNPENWGGLTTTIQNALSVTLPNDPQAAPPRNKTYSYEPVAVSGRDRQGYRLGATLENPKNPSLEAAAINTGTVGGVNCEQAESYCVEF